MTNAEQGLLIAIGEGVSNRLTNVGGSVFHADKISLAVEVLRQQIKVESQLVPDRGDALEQLQEEHGEMNLANVKYEKRIEQLEAAQKAIKDKLDWIRTDIAYKAPEQLTVPLFAEYLDLIREVLDEH